MNQDNDSHEILLKVQEMDSMSWQVVERILVILYEHGSLKKSQIAAKSGLKYNNCMRYLKWMHEKMEFVRFELNHDSRQIKSIHIAPKGMSFCKDKIFAKENVEIKERKRKFQSV